MNNDCPHRWGLWNRQVMGTGEVKYRVCKKCGKKEERRIV